jgi:hypothetical protein
MAGDELHTLLESKRWVTRRVDRVEFLDLTTVRRTISLTVRAGELRALLPGRYERLDRRQAWVPLGWFLPWANAGAALLDARGRVVPYITSKESDERVTRLVVRRLRRVGVRDAEIDLARKIPLHRIDPAARGLSCHACGVGLAQKPNHLELMADRWGCKAVRELLEALHEREMGTSCDRRRREVRELAMILLAWQTNFVLFTPLSGIGARGAWATLRLSFYEELKEWGVPEERGRKAERDGVELLRGEWKTLRRRISRGGPFSDELDRLFPHGPQRMLARSKWAVLRKLARRGFLRLTWHVAWHQASGLDTADHQIDVVLPDEMMAVRVRMLRKREGPLVANVADQVGSRATIVAPDADCSKAVGLTPPPPPAPTLFSLSIAQRSPASWWSGVWIAVLTGIAVSATAWFWPPKSQAPSADAVTMLVVAPTLVAALLSVRARSDLAEELTRTLRPLIGAVGVLAAVCAIGIVANRTGEHPVLTLYALKWLWTGCAIGMFLIAASLARGATQIKRFIAVGRRSAPRAVSSCDVAGHRALNPKGAPRISPPDLWLDADEGEIVPWGWLDGAPEKEERGLPPYMDDDFWKGGSRRGLVKWIQELFCYTPT